MVLRKNVASRPCAVATEERWELSLARWADFSPHLFVPREARTPETRELQFEWLAVKPMEKAARGAGAAGWYLRSAFQPIRDTGAKPLKG